MGGGSGPKARPRPFDRPDKQHMAMLMSNDVCFDRFHHLMSMFIFSCPQIPIAGLGTSLDSPSTSFRTQGDILKDIQTLVSLNMEAALQVSNSKL